MFSANLLDRIDSDALCSKCHCSCLCEPVHHALAHGIRQSVVQRPEASKTGHVDDGSLSLLKVRNGCLGHHEHWPYKDIIAPVKVINLTCVNVPCPRRSCIVDLESMRVNTLVWRLLNVVFLLIKIHFKYLILTKISNFPKWLTTELMIRSTSSLTVTSPVIR